MTKQEAKELSLEIWRYLAEHPEIKRKDGLPEHLFMKIVFMQGNCPLCFVLRGDCKKCPLKSCAGNYTLYRKWERSTTEQGRQAAAQRIAAIIEAWEPEEEKNETTPNS